MKRFVGWLKKQRDEYRSWPRKWAAAFWLNLLAILMAAILMLVATHASDLIQFAADTFLYAETIFAIHYAFHFYRRLHLEKIRTQFLFDEMKRIGDGEVRRGFQDFLESHPEMKGRVELSLGDEPPKWKH